MAERRLALAAMLALGVCPPAQAQVPATTDREIRGLIDGLAQSSCRFERNGSWYDGTRAAAHLQRKYDYLRKRERVASAEQFIEAAASRSSVTGRAYRVACAGLEPSDAGPWFRQRLSMLRRHPDGT